jgi:Pyruvate/2-oxoacid:ferredoxin oxidoreductase delta subunit
MYNVAQVIDEKCVAKKGCRLCIMYCPEANCLDLNSSKMVAEVNIDRCKAANSASSSVTLPSTRPSSCRQ